METLRIPLAIAFLVAILWAIGVAVVFAYTGDESYANSLLGSTILAFLLNMLGEATA